MERYTFPGGTAIVTGAASGIGEALAHGLGDRGSDLVLLDRDVDGLDRVADAVGRAHPDLAVDTVVVDLADRDAVRDTGLRLATEHAGATLLVNNAGVALGGRFDQVTIDEFERVIDVNFRAVVTLTHALLPVLAARSGSHLANVSSVFGLLAPPGQAAYASSKFAVRGFTEALRAELAGRVGVTCVHPGGIATRIADNALIGAGLDEAQARAGIDRMKRVLRIPPEVAADHILHGIERRRARVLIGLSASIPDLLVRLAPATTGTLLGLAPARLTDATAKAGAPSRTP